MVSRSWMLLVMLALVLWAPLPAQDANNSGERLDVNRAGVEELDRLPGIGPVRAAAIVRIRERNGPFKRVEELRALPRLSEKQFQRLRALVTVGQPSGEADKPGKDLNGGR